MSSIFVPRKCERCPSKGEGIFCELEGPVLDGVSEQKVENLFKKGQTLFVQGSPSYGLYCISKGNVKITKMGEDGKDSIVRIASEGDVLGHRSIFTDEHYQATATAMEDTAVCFIDRKFIVELMQREPSVGMNLLTKLSRDLGASEKRVASFSQRNVRERLCELLLMLKNSHGEKLANDKYKINLKLTREEMASMIGTATETLIRFMSELKDEGLVEQEGKTLIIPDEKKLLQFANLAY